MEKPTKIKGLHDVDVSKVPTGQIRYIDIYFGGQCNLECLYCFTDHKKGRLTTEDRKDLLCQARELGAETFVCTGAGEPMLDKGFRAIIRHAYNLGMTSVIYTNGNYITEDLANFMYNNNVSPLVKLESLNPGIHDKITKVAGSQKNAIKGIDNLLKAGYGTIIEGITRVGVAGVYTRLNIDRISDLKDYCDSKGILFMADELGLEKAALNNSHELFVEKERIDRIKSKLGIVESGIGSTHNSNETTCNFADYGLRIDQDGNVSYCTMQDLGRIVGNVLDEGLERIIKSVRMAKLVAIREKIKTINQVNTALARARTGYSISFPIGTCLFKAGDNLKVNKIVEK